jgi:hypothetical protein
MRISKSTFICAFIMSAIPLLANANSTFASLRVNNNTNSYATAKTGVSPCSSEVDSRGVINPKSSVDIPSIVFDLFCPAGCEVKLFMSKNCQQKVATLKVDKERGVTAINNDNVNNYKVSGGGFTISIDGGPAKKR